MIREATEADFERIHSIVMAPETNPFLSFEPMDLEAFRPLFAEITAQSRVWVWEEEGDVVGVVRTCRGVRRTAHVIYLGTLAVDPAWSGRGIGRRFMNELLMRIRTWDGIRRVELSAEADNPRALSFYESLGFQREGVMRGWFRRASDDVDIDEVMMGLLLY